MSGRVLLSLVLLCASRASAQSASQIFSPGNYQAPDGALLLQMGDNYVEPYFAAKALIVAQDAGLNIRRAALAWIHWALPLQRDDGRFDRYCRKQGEWQACAVADADDSMLALWLQLLYRMAPDRGIPAEWQQSVHRAQKQLAQLRNSRLGVYHVSGRNHVALFMDNVEVYAALVDIARAQSRFGDAQAAKATQDQARKLASAIEYVFWDNHNHRFRSSIQKSQPAFYPDVVGQVFPWLAGLPTPGEEPHTAWIHWRNQFAKSWIQRRYDVHPWGLVALAAARMGDDSTAFCWLSTSESLRYSSRWNILEEAVFQGLQHTLLAQQASDPRACLRVVGQL